MCCDVVRARRARVTCALTRASARPNAGPAHVCAHNRVFTGRIDLNQPNCVTPDDGCGRDTKRCEAHITGQRDWSQECAIGREHIESAVVRFQPQPFRTTHEHPLWRGKSLHACYGWPNPNSIIRASQDSMVSWLHIGEYAALP